MRLLLLSVLCLACHVPPARPAPASEPLREAAGAERVAVERVLDAFHDAAARADGEAYFGLLAQGAVFLGTDASERWDREAFRAYAGPYFERGTGWTYTPTERHVWVAGPTAWFDERLSNEKYGEVRGSGVLREGPQGWLLVHYNLSFPIPNDLAGEVVERIRERERKR